MKRELSAVEQVSVQELAGRRPGRPAACGVRRRLDVHHVVTRSQGGSDFDLDQLVALCRWCHDQTDAPCERGRLVVTARGGGQFHFDVTRRSESGNAPVEIRHRGPGELG
jgi:HNH endonuclease